MSTGLASKMLDTTRAELCKQTLCQKLLSFTATEIPSHSQNCCKHQSGEQEVSFYHVLMTPRLAAIGQTWQHHLLKEKE